MKSVKRSLDVVVDGTDGAGKSLCTFALRKHLEALGYKVAVCAPFREREVYPMWAADPVRAAQAIVDVMEAFRSSNPQTDIFLWDRGWPTAYITTRDAAALSLFDPLPSLTLLLLGSVEQTRDKAAVCGPKGIWVEDPELIVEYNRAYHDLASRVSCSLIPFYPEESGFFDLGRICRQVEELL